MATDTQITRLRELAHDNRLPTDAVDYVEGRIARGLTQDAAYELIRQLGGRIHNWREALPITPGKPDQAEPGTARLPLSEVDHD